jgi:hypothetical protein
MEKYCMKPTSEWVTADLLTLPVGEFDWLEIKGRRGLDLSMRETKEHHVLSAISKTLSAFSNSGGGKIIYGLVNPRSKWQVDDGGVALDMRRPTLVNG